MLATWLEIIPGYLAEYNTYEFANATYSKQHNEYVELTLISYAHVLLFQPSWWFHPYMLIRQPKHDFPIRTGTHVVPRVPFHHAHPSFTW